MLDEWLLNRSVREEISGQHKRKEYRPTVVAAVQNGEGQFIMVKHPVGGWFFPQGGIENGESLTRALRRELKEEVGIEGSVTRINLLITRKLPYIAGRPVRDGFRVGKEYFVCTGEISETKFLWYKEDELAGACFVEPDQLEKVAGNMEPGKAALVYAVLRRLCS